MNKKLAPETDFQNTLINSHNNVKQDISMMIPISVFKLYTRVRGIFLFSYKFTLLSYFGVHLPTQVETIERRSLLLHFDSKSKI